MIKWQKRNLLRNHGEGRSCGDLSANTCSLGAVNLVASVSLLPIYKLQALKRIETLDDS